MSSRWVPPAVIRLGPNDSKIFGPLERRELGARDLLVTR